MVTDDPPLPPDPDDFGDPDATPDDELAAADPATPDEATPDHSNDPTPTAPLSLPEPGQRLGEPPLRLVPDHVGARNLIHPEPLAHERACLGALITEPRLVRTLPNLRDRHFGENGLHAHVFRAVLVAEVEGGPGPEVVVRVLEQDAGFHVGSGTVGGYVFELVQACTSTANVGWFAQRVVEYARVRAIAGLTRSMVEHVQLGVPEDLLIERVGAAVDLLGSLLTPVDVGAAQGAPDGLIELGALGREPEEDRNWALPGLLEVGDRVMIVAGEGSGKSVLMRSVAAAGAAGRHPFVPSVRIPPIRTVVVDLENPRGIIRRTVRPIMEYLGNYGPWTDGQAWLWSQPGGIDLRRREDALRLTQVIEYCRPQLLCLGPIYKSYVEGSNDKAAAAAREVQHVLDGIRVNYGCALWLEAHAPLEQQGKRSLRPMNSQLWTAWPEFGIGMRVDKSKDRSGRTFALERWRGDRDERDWPTHLTRAGLTGQRWPWEAAWHGDDEHEGGMPDWLRAAQLRDGMYEGGQSA